MSINPARLQCVTPYEVEADQLKTLVRIGYVRPRDITKHVGFATACRAGARAAQRLELEKRLRAVVPGDRKLLSYLLNIDGLESH
jgi:hypothetical protein